MQEVAYPYDAEELLYSYQLCYSDAFRERQFKVQTKQFKPNLTEPIKIKTNKNSVAKQQRRRYKTEPRKAVLLMEPKVQLKSQSPAPDAEFEPLVMPQPLNLHKFDNHIPAAFSIIKRGNLPSIELPFN